MNTHSVCHSRREILKWLASAALLPLYSSSGSLYAAETKSGGGCLLFNSDNAQTLLAQSQLIQQHDLAHSTGDSAFDHTLGSILVGLSKQFAVQPVFGLYQAASPNALALQTEGKDYVLFDQTLLSQLRSAAHGELAIKAICAHEFAHVVQYHSDYYARLTTGLAPKYAELHADFLSGYYLGLRQGDYSAGELLALGKYWETLGDCHFNSPQHHGSADERLDAIEQGFLFARQRPNFNVMAACEVAARYLGV